MEASASGAVYVIVQHDNQGAMTWDEFLKPGNIVYVGSAYGRLNARYYNHCRDTVSKLLFCFSFVLFTFFTHAVSATEMDAKVWPASKRKELLLGTAHAYHDQRVYYRVFPQRRYAEAGGNHGHCAWLAKKIMCNPLIISIAGITSLRNSQHPMGGFTVDNDERFHMLEKSLMKIAAVTLYSTWERHFKDKFVVDGDTIFKLSTGADLHASKGKP